IGWNCIMQDMLSGTKNYCQLTQQEENGLGMRWSELAVMSRVAWAAEAQAEIVGAIPLEKDKEAKLLLDPAGGGKEADEEESEIEDEVVDLSVRRDGANGGNEEAEVEHGVNQALKGNKTGV
ncbi:hypothetical protein DFH28DRAFT_906550, partial [Melampsora americana]